jgi:hypothetical protein
MALMWTRFWLSTDETVVPSVVADVEDGLDVPFAVLKDRMHGVALVPVGRCSTGGRDM